MAVALAAAGLALAAAGTYMSYRGQKKAADAAQKQQQITSRRSKRQAIREAQIRRAQTLAAAGGAGGLTGSAVAGGIGSLGSQLASNFGYSSQMSGLSSLINMGQQQAGFGKGLQALGQQVQSLAKFAAGGGFGGGTEPTPTKPPAQGVGSFYNFRPMG